MLSPKSFQEIKEKIYRNEESKRKTEFNSLL